MDEDWTPLLNKDCMLFSPSGFPLDDDFHLTDLDYHPDKIIKTETRDETSDYHGSASESPSSSLSSPDMKDNFGVDLSFCIPFSGNIHPFLHSPTDNNGSTVGHVSSNGNVAPQSHNQPPSIDHFSHQTPSQQQHSPHRQQRTQHTVVSPPLRHTRTPVTSFNIVTQEKISFFDAVEDRTPSPPTSDRSSPTNGAHSDNVVYTGLNRSSFSSSNVMINSLSTAQQQLKSRSKMHEMAVRQRLITDQDPRSQGLVQLSAEERRTLMQEGYPVPTRLPLSKAEEESLKIVRRKIKNKLSAQESRRKRKEYMDTLESRCQAYFNENVQLKNRVKQLELANQKLAMQMKKLQNIINANGQHVDVPAVH